MSCIDPRLLSLSSESTIMSSEPATMSEPTTITTAQRPRRSRRRTRPNLISNHTVLVTKKQRKPRTKKSVVRQAQDPPHDTDSDGDSDSIVATNDGIRWKDGSLQWWDDKERRWKPARYHRDCRAELLQLAAQQPGAPVWAPHEGTDQTSFSNLTRGWTEDDLWSVVDAKGRHVLLMNQPPADFKAKKVKHEPLKLGGCVLLDGRNKPVRDIPGLPLTLATKIEPWFLIGLRRSLRIDLNDVMARVPEYWQAKNEIRKACETKYTMRQARWLKEMGLEEWHPRLTSRAKGRSKATSSRPSNAADTGATPSAYNTDEAWVTSRETSILPDPGRSAAYNQYVLALAAHHASQQASHHANNPWVMRRETGVYPDPDINAPGSQYPLQPSYHGFDNAWAPTQGVNMYQDPGIPAPLSKYPVSFFHNHPPAPTDPMNLFKQQPYDNLVNGEFDDFDHDYDNHDVSGHREMTDYLHDNDVNTGPMLVQDPFSGLQNL